MHSSCPQSQLYGALVKTNYPAGTRWRGTCRPVLCDGGTETETISEPWRNQKESERGFIRGQRFQSWEGFASGEVHEKVKSTSQLKENYL